MPTSALQRRRDTPMPSHVWWGDVATTSYWTGPVGSLRLTFRDSGLEFVPVPRYIFLYTIILVTAYCPIVSDVIIVILILNICGATYYFLSFINILIFRTPHQWFFSFFLVLVKPRVYAVRVDTPRATRCGRFHRKEHS